MAYVIMYKRTIPILITAITMSILIIEYFYAGGKQFTIITQELQRWAIIVAGFALCLATCDLLLHHIPNINKRKEDWPYSVVLIGTILTVIIVGLVGEVTGPIQWIVITFLQPAQQVIMFLMNLYILVMFYRAMRVRDINTAGCFIALILSLFYFASWGPLIFPGINNIGPFFRDVINLSASRAYIILITVGLSILGIRYLLGLETRYLGRSDQE